MTSGTVRAPGHLLEERVALRFEDDPGDAAPEDRARAHGAGLGGRVEDEVRSVYAGPAVEKVHHRRRLAVQDGALLGVVEAFGQDLAGTLLDDEATKWRIGVAARYLYRPPHVAFAIHAASLRISAGHRPGTVYRSSRCRSAPSSCG